MDLVEYFEDLAKQILDTKDIHDISTPFSLMMGGANILDKFDLYQNDEQKKKIEEICSQVNLFIYDAYPNRHQ